MSDTPVSVLVCDDTAAKRYVISSWLRRAGYHVLEAETGREALEVASSSPLDLAVLDVHLPDMSGFEVCAAIKSRTSNQATPVLHISAVAVDPEDRSTGLDQGADAYLVDPIEPAELLATVRALLRTSGARRDAERLATGFGRLSTATLRINVALSVSRLASSAARGAARVVEHEAVALLLDQNEASPAARTNAHGVTSTWQVPGEVAATLVSDAGTSPVVRHDQAPWDALLAHSATAEWTIVPVLVGGTARGLVGVPRTAGSAPNHGMLLQRLMESVSVALSNLRVRAEEQRIALMLQRSLLPATLPPLPGLTVAARYKASGEQVEIGGDFFDAFQTDDGSGVVVIGDVQGHSLEAAVLMAELRYSLRAYAHDGYAPNEVLDRLDALLQRNHPEMTATVCMLVFPPGGSSVLVANAGHIPPLLVHEGKAAYLPNGGPLLGLEVPAAKPNVVELAVGDRLLLMTDGLVERRNESLAALLEEVAEDVAGTELPAEALCDHLMDRWGGGEDDVALIVLDILHVLDNLPPVRPAG